MPEKAASILSTEGVDRESLGTSSEVYHKYLKFETGITAEEVNAYQETMLRRGINLDGVYPYPVTIEGNLCMVFVIDKTKQPSQIKDGIEKFIGKGESILK